MEDLILKKFMEPERWRYAISKGVEKGICKADLYQLTKPSVRIKMAKAIADGKYEVAPPHTALIPKEDKNEFRTVYINESMDRVFLSVANDLLFELMPEMVHKNCRAYRKGIGCGDTVIGISNTIMHATGVVIGFKSDLSKYFDSVPIKYIDGAFDKVEKKYGHSSVIDVLRKYYHSDWYFDTDKKLKQSYQSLKQGCSVASWLADVILYEIDKKMTEWAEKNKYGIYLRYSDDMLFIGKNYKDAMKYLSEALAKMNMKLNPKKVEYIQKDKWFKFLGFTIKGGSRSLGKTRLKSFQKMIQDATKHGTSKEKALNNVNRVLYKGNGEFSWATSVLKVLNVEEDLKTMDNFVKDALRAAETDHHKIGGLGYVATQKVGCITRGKGKNVRSNRSKTEPEIEGYKTLICMRNALLTGRSIFDTLVRML